MDDTTTNTDTLADRIERCRNRHHRGLSGDDCPTLDEVAEHLLSSLPVAS